MSKNTTENKTEGLRCARCQRKMSDHTIAEFFDCINDVCALTAIAVLVLGGFLLPEGFAFQMQNIDLDENLQPIDLPASNPAMISVHSGMIHGTITSRDSFVMESNMPDFVSSEGINPEGGYTASFAGFMGNNTQTITVLNSDGNVGYSVILIPEQQSKQPEQQGWQLSQIQQIDNWVYWTVGLGIVVVLIGCVVAVRRSRMGGVRIIR